MIQVEQIGVGIDGLEMVVGQHRQQDYNNKIKEKKWHILQK
jgi:hypothetical protein